MPVGGTCINVPRMVFFQGLVELGILIGLI